MNLTISFPGAEQKTLTEVVGKGYSLIRMVEAGLPVPPGAVLTTEFFEPWFNEMKTSATWPALAEAKPDKWSTLCSELKRAVVYGGRPDVYEPIQCDVAGEFKGSLEEQHRQRCRGIT